MSAEAHIAAHDEHYDPVGQKIGMWLFLYTELILFGGLFLLYAAYCTRYGADFKECSLQLDRLKGSINTIFLLTSSLTMALSIWALRAGNKRRSMGLLWATIGFALGFFTVKYFEWSAKIGHGLYPKSPELLKESYGANLFYGLYYGMTGLHGLHVLIGVGAISYALWLVRRDRITRERYIFLENAGLYWHLVDLIWIYLFPLFYLVA